MSSLKVNTINDANGGSNAVLYGVAAPANSMGFRNRIINGDMRIDQRNAGASVSTVAGTSTYTLDRFYYFASQASKFTVQQNAGAVTPPVGFTNYLGVTSSSAYTVGSAEAFVIGQAIEGFNVADLGWGTASAQAVTLSFQVRSSLTGTFGGSLRNNASNRSYPFSYTISSANTWSTVSVTIAGDTTGAWATNNALGINLTFGLGVGSTGSSTAGAWASGNFTSATGAVSVVGTNGATFYITGVQLEAGSVASPFERRPYSTELQLAQRYYQKYGRLDLYPTNNDFSKRRVYVPRTVTMRATPTETGTQGAGGTVAFYGSASNVGMDVDGATLTLTSECSNYTASSEL